MRPVLFTLGAALLLSACDQALIGQGSAPRPGFALVQDSTRQATGQDSVWHLSAAELDANAARVSALVNGKTIGPDRAVQVALMNNRALQAAYADLGLSGADLWETALGPIPTLNLSVTNLGEEGFARTLEATLTTSLLDLATLKPRKRMAEMDFRQAQLDATGATLALAYETRRAWIEAVGAFEAAALIGAAQGTADAGSELASELGRTGAMNRADQAREHVFTAELAGERAHRKLEAQLAKERLIRLMGLWGSDINVYIPDRLPDLPGGVTARPDIERLALTHRVDLAAGRLELERIASEMAGARVIHLVGLRRAFAVVSNMAYLFDKLGIPANLHYGAGMLNTEGTIFPEDVLFAVTFSPFSEETVRLAKSAAERGVTVFGLTDTDRCPIAGTVSEMLVAREHEVAGFRALSAAMTLTTTLVVAVGARRQGVPAEIDRKIDKA